MTQSAPKLLDARSLIGAFVVLGLLPACKKSVEVNRTAYIIGATNDMLPYDKTTERRVDPPVANAAVLIATKLKTNRIKFCSGTLLLGEQTSDNDRILTNHHCFADTDSDGKATPSLIAEACTDTTVYFGFTIEHAAQSWSTKCHPGSLRTNFDGDLGVFTLEKNPPDPYKPSELWDGDDASTVGRKALIIHFPDVPENMALPGDGTDIKLPTAAVTLDDCTVLGPFDVSEWDLDRTLPYSLRHTCDLIHGSSGSGLIDAETGKVLGVNWGGIKIAIDGGTRTDNVATKASFAAAFLAGGEASAISAANSRRADSGDAIGATAPSDKPGKGGVKNKLKGCGVAATTNASMGDEAGFGTVLSALVLMVGWPASLLMRRKK